MSATKHALDTTELLTLIIIALPDASKLHAQRVCSRWRDIIESDIRLQELLHFRISRTSLSQDDVPSYNQLLVKRFDPFFKLAEPVTSR